MHSLGPVVLLAHLNGCFIHRFHAKCDFRCCAANIVAAAAIIVAVDDAGFSQAQHCEILCRLCKLCAHFVSISSMLSVAHAQMYSVLIKINVEMGFNKTHFGGTNNKHHGKGSHKEMNITRHNSIHRNKTIKIQYCSLANEATAMKNS